MQTRLRQLPLAFLGATALLGLGLGFGKTTVLGAEDPQPGSVSGTFVTETRIKTRGATSEKDLVVYLMPKAEVELKPCDARIAVVQQKLQFNPHVVPAQIGSTISFENLDTVTHNVFADHDCCGVDMDMDAGKETDLVVDKAGVVPVICRLHPEMELYLVVLDHPWFTSAEFEKKTVDDQRTYEASFSIENVPPGEYTLTYWNKSLDLREFPITIESGKNVVQDIVD